MLRGLKTALVALSVLGVAALTGCAEVNYPRLPDLGGIGRNLLTPQEQQKTINDMRTEQETHGAEAAKEIEGRN